MLGLCPSYYVLSRPGPPFYSALLGLCPSYYVLSRPCPPFYNTLLGLCPSYYYQGHVLLFIVYCWGYVLHITIRALSSFLYCIIRAVYQYLAQQRENLPFNIRRRFSNTLAVELEHFSQLQISIIDALGEGRCITRFYLVMPVKGQRIRY